MRRRRWERMRDRRSNMKWRLMLSWFIDPPRATGSFSCQRERFSRIGAARYIARKRLRPTNQRFRRASLSLESQIIFVPAINRNFDNRIYPIQLLCFCSICFCVIYNLQVILFANAKSLITPIYLADDRKKLIDSVFVFFQVRNELDSFLCCMWDATFRERRMRVWIRYALFSAFRTSHSYYLLLRQCITHSGERYHRSIIGHCRNTRQPCRKTRPFPYIRDHPNYFIPRRL